MIFCIKNIICTGTRFRQWAILVAFGMPLLVSNFAEAQIRSGSAFLKLVPGARHQGMASALTGAIDEPHAFYANPAAAGFLREWQWSTTYTEWFADVYNLSFIYGRRLETPWGRRLGLAFGINYQGVREFDSTNDLQSPATANDLLITTSLGSAISKKVSIGANIKYFRSKLAELSASSWIFDAGALYRSQPIKIGSIFDYGYFSAGIAVTQLGRSLKFISESTPLPRTWQAGVAFNLGAHNGLQIQIAGDYRKIRNEAGQFSLGGELLWRYGLGLRAGYNFNDDILSKFSFGLSLRLDDRSSPARDFLPGRNNAVRVDVAGLESNQFFSAAYRAGINHYPIGPEHFEFIQPINGANIREEGIDFIWQTSSDPDLYDNVNYVLLLEKSEYDSLKLEQFVKEAETADKNLQQILQECRDQLYFVNDSAFHIDEVKQQVDFSKTILPAGEYAWTVLAYDKDQHVRFAERDGKKIWYFTILPDLLITQMTFDYNQWITEDDYQGDVLITVKNIGTTKSEPVNLAVYDSVVTPTLYALNGHTPADGNDITFASIYVPEISAGADTTVKFSWHTGHPGQHQITAAIDPHNRLMELVETNNDDKALFYTIPKGAFKTADRVIAQIDTVYEYELPFIPKIFFDHNSSELHLAESTLMYSPLDTLAKRLGKNPDIYLNLQGTTNLADGESKSLAVERAQVVKEYLIKIGVPENQVRVPKKLQRYYSDPIPKIDSTWVREERRHVKILARSKQNNQEVSTLFHSVPVTLPKSKTFYPVDFTSTVKGYVPMQIGWVYLRSDTLRSEIPGFQYAANKPDTISWVHHEFENSRWTNKRVSYYVMLEDTLGRTFYTPQEKVFLDIKKGNLLPKKILIGVAEFREDNPPPNLPWQNVVEKVKTRLLESEIDTMRFIGHACAIGDSAYNDILSEKRAENFKTQFKREFRKRQDFWFNKQRYLFENIGIDGRGENEPFCMQVDKNSFLEALKIQNEQEYRKLIQELTSGIRSDNQYPFTFKFNKDTIIIVSDNNTPFGRQINRRIEILMDSKQASPQEEFTKK